MNHHDHLHDLEHHDTSQVDTKKIGIFVVLLIALFFVELVGGYIFNSVALMSDALHVAADSFAIILAFATLQLKKRKANGRQTYGYYRSEVIATLINCVVLFLSSIYILYSGIHRLINPAEMEGLKVLVIASIGLAVNLVGLKLIHNHDSMVVKSAYLEALADAASSLGVILGALLIYYFNIVWLDPLIAMAISFFILYRVYYLFKKTTRILLESVPEHIEFDEVRAAILSVKGVVSLHQLHIWDITDKETSLSVHLIVEAATLPELQSLRTDLEAMLENQFNISHTTIQTEIVHC